MKRQKIPSFFRPILWSYQFSKLNPEQDARAIMVQTINYGQWRHWLWLVRRYGKSKLRQILKEVPMSEFRPRALQLARILFGISKMNYVSRVAYIQRQKNLAKT